MIREQRSRGPWAVIAISAIVVSLGAASIPPTDAQWSDPASFTVTAGTGTWTAPSTLGTCAIVDTAGAPVPGETCTVTTVNLIENGGLNPGSLFREYQLTVDRSTPDPALEVKFQIDLSSPDVGTVGPTPNPAWSWDNASTTATGGYSTPPGYPCNRLPILEGTVPGNVSGPVAIDVHDSLVPTRTCT